MKPTLDHPAIHGESQSPSTTSLPWRTALLMLGLIVLFFALREHWGHLLGYLPYLVLLLCPLMHLFMHRGHQHHHASRHDQHGNDAS